eukprot:1179497-Prorocentrum_minimum.AAC.1
MTGGMREQRAARLREEVRPLTLASAAAIGSHARYIHPPLLRLVLTLGERGGASGGGGLMLGERGGASGGGGRGGWGGRGDASGGVAAPVARGGPGGAPGGGAGGGHAGGHRAREGGGAAGAAAGAGTHQATQVGRQHLRRCAPTAVQEPRVLD